MSYTPTEWKTGDVITAPKLNNIEQGIVNAPGVAVFEFEVISDDNNRVVTNTTVQDVIDKFTAGKLCVARIFSHNSAQPADMSLKQDLIMDCFAKGGILIATRNEISSSHDKVRIDAEKLSGNSSGWTYSSIEYLV